MARSNDSNETISLSPSVFNIENPYILIEISSSEFSDTLMAYIPLTTMPYVFQSGLSEEALYADASVVSGNFTATVNIQSDVKVYDADGDAFFVVDHENGRVGIGTEAPDYELDVDGIVNAEGYYIDGENILEKFSWNRNDNVLYFNEEDTVVGIGTDDPLTEVYYEPTFTTYNIVLDVHGTMNVEEILIKQIPILTIGGCVCLADGVEDGDIYFDAQNDGNVGIGVSDNLYEQLVVSGAIKISNSFLVLPMRELLSMIQQRMILGYIDNNEPIL